MNLNRSKSIIAALSLTLVLNFSAAAGKGKPTPPPPSDCTDLAVTWQFESIISEGADIAAIRGDGTPYDAVIYACNTGDARLDTGNSRSIWIQLPNPGAPGWADGYHHASVNIKRLLHNIGNPSTLFQSLDAISDQYTFTTVMIVRPDAYGDYPIWFHNTSADTYAYINNTAPSVVASSATALVRVTHTITGTTHQWVVEPVPDAAAVQTYTERDRTEKNKLVTKAIGPLQIPFRIKIQTQP